MSTLEVNKITPVSGGTTVTLGNSGDTFNLASGATAGFGKVLQAVSNTYASGQITTTSSAMTDAISQAITPAASSSKVLVLLCFNFHGYLWQGLHGVKLQRIGGVTPALPQGELP